MQLLYAFGLLGLYFVLLVGEFFLPTGGALGIAAAITAVASAFIAFTYGPITGFVVVVAIAVSTPTILYLAVGIWPSTPIGKLILNRTPGQIDAPIESRTRSGEKRKDLVGKIGIAKSNLLPGGLIELDGERLDAVSIGVPIDAGTEVIVVSVVTGKLKVRPTTDDERASVIGVTEQVASDDSPLPEAIPSNAFESSLETFEFEGFEEDSEFDREGN
ncbi:NfeD family protein [Rhodopirellula sp. MGV]|uniref:NfeD family protein n=1 Tax=Rhodopirellula sp. MGV TaxID=2023130 RepID=UPI000B97478A|nr:NfeD family protein [Rhodopirellula sp. MGV]OYP35711.1 hypothetical protein CGZ80_11055 [Rhodopirellula sp. MGV]PNY35006.1 nodulation protein NfeD [Rhodopirellula baltica]